MESVNFSSAPTLRGNAVTLEPLSTDHTDELAVAVGERDLWRIWYTRIPSPDEMRGDIEERLAKQARGKLAPWTIRRNSDGRAVGMTTFLNLRQDNRRLEIGSTWLATSAQRTGINTESKLLLLTRAFETLDCIAVEFRTHWHNLQSRQAIAGLGAKQDGVLRNQDLWRDGTLRDVVVFSVIASEWPTVKLSLSERHRAR